MPAIAFGEPAWLDTILDSVERRIADAAKVPRARVFAFAGSPDDLLDAPPAEQFVTVWFESLNVEQDLLVGGGVTNVGFDDVLTVDLFQRFTTDRENTDTRLLRDTSKGFAALTRRIAKALTGWFDPTAANTSIFREPVRLLGIQLRGRKPANGWARATLRFSARFVADFTEAD